MSARKPSVLITGASGYVGRLTVRALADRGADLAGIVAVDVVDVPAADRLDGVEYVTADVVDPALGDLMKEHRVDSVVHLASIIRSPKGAPADLAYKVDVLGTKNVLDACLAAKVDKLIVTSSGAAYGYHADNDEWLSEDSPLRGNADFVYSHHKRIVEQMLADYRRDHPELEQLVFRPGTILGPDVSSPITDLFEKRALLGVMGSSTPFVFIWDQDVVACIEKGLFEDRCGVFNLAGDGAMTTREIAKYLGKPYLPVPAWLLRFALGALRRAGLTQYGPEQVNFLRYRPVLSNKRLKDEFGYLPKLSSRGVFELYAGAR